MDGEESKCLIGSEGLSGFSLVVNMPKSVIITALELNATTHTGSSAFPDAGSIGTHLSVMVDRNHD